MNYNKRYIISRMGKSVVDLFRSQGDYDRSVTSFRDKLLNGNYTTKIKEIVEPEPREEGNSDSEGPIEPQFRYVAKSQPCVDDFFDSDCLRCSIWFGRGTGAY